MSPCEWHPDPQGVAQLGLPRCLGSRKGCLSQASWPSLLVVDKWMLLAEGVLMVNVWLLVGSGAHLVQIFIIGLLSLGPVDGRKLADHPIQEGVPRLPKPRLSKGQEAETIWALGPRSKRGWRLMEGWRQGSGRTCGTCDSIPDCRVSLSSQKDLVCGFKNHLCVPDLQTHIPRPGLLGSNCSPHFGDI